MRKTLNMQKPQFFLGFCRFFLTSQTFRLGRTTTQSRSRSLPTIASHKDRAKNSFGGRFWKDLGRPWASLGRLWGPLGQLLAPVGHFLGVSWARLGPSWPSLCWSVALLSSVLTSRGAPGVDFRRFWDVPGSVLDGFWSWLGLFSAVPRTSLHIVFIDAAPALLHLLALCLLPFWCGGLCAAHPPPPEGRAERAR